MNDTRKKQNFEEELLSSTITTTTNTKYKKVEIEYLEAEKVQLWKLGGDGESETDSRKGEVFKNTIVLKCAHKR